MEFVTASHHHLYSDALYHSYLGFQAHACSPRDPVAMARNRVITMALQFPFLRSSLRAKSEYQETRASLHLFLTFF